MNIAFKLSSGASAPYFGCYVPMKILQYLVILSLLFPIHAMAEMSSPSDIAQKYNELFYAQKYKDAFALYDSSELKVTRFLTSKSFKNRLPANLEQMVFGELSDKEISELSDSAYLDIFYTTAMKGGRNDYSANVTAKIIVLGTAYDGKDTAYVTCKNTISLDQNIIEAVELVRLKKINGKWYVGMPSEIAGFNDTIAKLTNQSITDLLTEDQATDGEIQVLDAKPDNAVITGEVDTEFTSTMEDGKENALKELKRRAYISAAHAIMDVKIEAVKLDGIYRIKGSAKTLVFKVR